MSLLDWNLSPKDNARVQSVLQDDERVVLVTRPRPQMDIVEAVGRVFSGVVLLGILAYALYQMAQVWWLVLAFVSPLILYAAWLISSPARYRRQKERTLYLLTDKRVLMLEPKGIFGARVVAYPLQPNPVKAVQHGDDGYGDIIFAYEQHWEIFPKMRHRTTPVGFIEVPEVMQVEHLIAAQVAATPPAVPLPAAQPPTLAGLPTETDSWGNPVATSMQRPVMITLGILFLLFDAVFLVIGILMLSSDARLEKEGVRTMATVLSVRKEEGAQITTTAPVPMSASAWTIPRNAAPAIVFSHACSSWMPPGWLMSLTPPPAAQPMISLSAIRWRLSTCPRTPRRHRWWIRARPWGRFSP